MHEDDHVVDHPDDELFELRYMQARYNYELRRHYRHSDPRDPEYVPPPPEIEKHI